jgi:EAL domain-containing protein (putative c-di-GMP-specific phosphodiesterase class I)/CheY-like chemotaxis protein
MIRDLFLILDDDIAVGEVIQLMAQSLGFETHFCTTAEDFFRKFITLQPDVITIDLVMPGLDGVQVMRVLAELKCGARIIISSGMDKRVLEAAHRSASEHGLNVVGVLRKPCSKESLRNLLGEIKSKNESDLGENGLAHSSQFKIVKSDLQRAIAREEIVMAYQPKIKCTSGEFAGFEALVRWQHPTKGIIPPAHFIPVAEEIGLIDGLTTTIFGQSCEWFSKHFSQSSIKLSLNLSAKSLGDLKLADEISALCRRFGIAPERIVIELTETSAMVDPLLSLDLIIRLRMKGFCISIDDFGTGYSSIVQLVRLPFSEIKVDKSFVITSQQSIESRAVINSIIELGHSLGMVVTAEGVEDLATQKYLTDHGCDLAQGYFIGRPMWGEDALVWVDQYRARPPIS